MAKSKIIVVEDEELVALAIKTFLERAGYEVPAVFSSGEEVAERFKALSPDLILMDIRLDGRMSGIDAAAVIKETSKTPVIYLTAYSDVDTLEMAKMTEPFGYVLKPFDERALQVTIKMALHKAAVQKKLETSKDQMSSILQSIGDGILLAASDGTVEFVNAAARDLLKLPDPIPPSTAILKLLSVNDPKTRAPIAISLDRVVSMEETVEMNDCMLSAKGGRGCLVDLRIEPFRNGESRVQGMVWTFRNVSERSKLQSLINRELESATDFHKSLLPSSSLEISGCRTGSFLLAATYGAGDIYGIFKIDETHLGIYIIDVMGHGVAASSIALLLSRLLSPDPRKGNMLPFLGADPRSPKLVAEKLNDLFYGSSDQMFFTMCYCVLDKEAGKVTLVRAGHPYPILQKANGRVEEIKSGGYAIGLARIVETPETELHVSAGDRLILYSDGLTECADSRSIHFSREKLATLIGHASGKSVVELVAGIRKEVVAWRGQESFDDDISMIAVQIG